MALYYKEEGVLFLLLNHFLKVCNGNVARCYDETAEAIATANGYSHLMDFFQYYDCIARCVRDRGLPPSSPVGGFFLVGRREVAAAAVSCPWAIPAPAWSSIFFFLE